MIRVLFLSLFLVISATMADIAQNGPASTVTWGNRRYSFPRRTAIHKNIAFFAYRYPQSRTSPITLAQVNLEGNQHRQRPFPNLAMQQRGNCSALQSVADIFVDAKGLLWVLDTGENDLFPCEPKIVAFGTTTGKVLRIIDLSRAGGRHSDFSHIVVDHKRKGRPFVYVLDVKTRTIFVINYCSCNHRAIPLPDTPILDQKSHDITLNLVRKGDDRQLIINDEPREKMYCVRLKDVPACSELPEGLLQFMKASGKVILGNDELSTVYFREKSNEEVIVYKIDALNATVHQTVVYMGNPLAFPRHVVPDHTKGGVRLLESKIDIKDHFLEVTNSLIPI